MNYPLEPLIEATGLNISHLAEHLGVDRQSLYRWQRNGIPEKRLDELAVKCGLVVYEIWPAWLEESNRLAAEAAEEEHGRFLEWQERRRRIQRESARRRYWADSAVRDRKIAASRRYWQECSPAILAKRKVLRQARKAS